MNAIDKTLAEDSLVRRYDPKASQAFAHLSLIDAALNLN